MTGRFDQALAFAAVAELGSFTRAAERLGVSKAHLSKQVSDLETALGLRLMQRTTRRLNLTEAGHLYLGYATRMRDLLLDGAHNAAGAGALAAAVEAFWSSATWMPLALKYSVAAVCWISVFTYLFRQGRDAA